MNPIRAPWPGEMTARERFNRQIRHQSVDRCFNMEFGYWRENFRAWPMFADSGITSNPEADRFFSFDPFGKVSGNVWIHPGFSEQVVEETAEKKVVRNREGLLAEVPKDSHSTIPHFVGATVRTPADWQQAKAEHFRLDDPARQVDVEAIRQQHPPERDYPLAVDCGSMIGKIRDMLTFEGLAYASFDYPDMVEDMVETCCQLVEQFLEQVLGKIDFDVASGWEDICFRSGPLVTLDFFENVVVPRYRRIGKKLRAAGIDVWYTDCDGDIRPLIPSFLSAGVNCMFPFEVHCAGHPGEVLDAYGPELRILGGVDKRVLARSQAEIRKYLQSLVPYVEQGGFIPHVDHRCPPDVPQENYLYYLNTKRELFGRPLPGREG
ncbi:MAG: uroporphyrinogen decarboxylase family protein [Planctomycetota bacterium]